MNQQGDGRRPTLSRPTIRDIAAEVGMSIKTVSRALNGETGVSPTTTERVHRAARELGFRRNDLARGLRRGGGTGTVGLVLEHSTTHFYRGLIAGVGEVAHRHDVLVITVASHSAEREEASLLALSRSRVDGLLVVPASDDHSFLQPEQAAGVPLVFIDRSPRGIDADSVVADDRGGGRSATEHLLAHGHRAIAVVGGQAVETVRGRVAGYRDALTAAGVAHDDGLVVLDCVDQSAAYRGVAALLARDPHPTALFTLNAVCTIGAVRAVRDAGHRDRVAIVGFDDFETADLVDPPVTVIQHDVVAVGRAAAEVLFDRIAGDGGPVRRVELATALVTRGSGEIPGPSL